MNHSLIYISIIVLIVLIVYFSKEKLTNEKEGTWEGGYLSNLLNKSKTYVGHPLDDTVYDSGADLRFAQEFTSTDENFSSSLCR